MTVIINKVVADFKLVAVTFEIKNMKTRNSLSSVGLLLHLSAQKMISGFVR